MDALRPRIMWAVTRDGEIWMLQRSRKFARSIVAAYRQGSKHDWSCCRVRVTPLKTKERRR